VVSGSRQREKVYPAFLDTETVSLVQGDGVLWEVGLITPPGANGTPEVYHRWQLRPDMSQADPESLKICGFDSRYVLLDDWDAGYAFAPGPAEAANKDLTRLTRAEAASGLWAALSKQVIAGMVPNFDTERIGLWLHRWRPPWLGVPPGQEWRARVPDPWHYHLVDVEGQVAGRFGIPPKWDSEELSRVVGVDPGRFARHTALGDCLWARAVYDSLIGLPKLIAPGG
jgi:hypothetical protein